MVLPPVREEGGGREMTCTICKTVEVAYPHLVIIHNVIHECCDACFDALCEGVQ